MSQQLENSATTFPARVPGITSSVTGELGLSEAMALNVLMPYDSYPSPPHALKRKTPPTLTAHGQPHLAHSYAYDERYSEDSHPDATQNNLPSGDTQQPLSSTFNTPVYDEPYDATMNSGMAVDAPAELGDHGYYVQDAYSGSVYHYSDPDYGEVCQDYTEQASGGNPDRSTSSQEIHLSLSSGDVRQQSGAISSRTPEAQSFDQRPRSFPDSIATVTSHRGLDSDSPTYPEHRSTHWSQAVDATVVATGVRQSARNDDEQAALFNDGIPQSFNQDLIDAQMDYTTSDPLYRQRPDSLGMLPVPEVEGTNYQDDVHPSVHGSSPSSDDPSTSVQPQETSDDHETTEHPLTQSSISAETNAPTPSSTSAGANTPASNAGRKRVRNRNPNADRWHELKVQFLVRNHASNPSVIALRERVAKGMKFARRTLIEWSACVHELCSTYGLAGASGATIPSPTGEPLAVTKEDIAVLINRSPSWVGYCLTAWKRLNDADIMAKPGNDGVREAFARYQRGEAATSDDVRTQWGIQTFILEK